MRAATFLALRVKPPQLNVCVPLAARSIGITLRALPARRTSPPLACPERPETRTVTVALPERTRADVIFTFGARTRLVSVRVRTFPPLSRTRSLPSGDAVTVSPAATFTGPDSNVEGAPLDVVRSLYENVVAAPSLANTSRVPSRRALTSEALAEIVAEAPAEVDVERDRPRRARALEREPAGDRAHAILDADSSRRLDRRERPAPQHGLAVAAGLHAANGVARPGDDAARAWDRRRVQDGHVVLLGRLGDHGAVGGAEQDQRQGGCQPGEIRQRRVLTDHAAAEREQRLVAAAPRLAAHVELPARAVGRDPDHALTQRAVLMHQPVDAELAAVERDVAVVHEHVGASVGLVDDVVGQDGVSGPVLHHADHRQPAWPEQLANDPLQLCAQVLRAPEPRVEELRRRLGRVLAVEVAAHAAVLGQRERVARREAAQRGRVRAPSPGPRARCRSSGPPSSASPSR